MSSFSEHTLTAKVQGSGTWDGILDVDSGTITLDEGWSPYCQSKIIVTTPTDDYLDLIDPRVNPRVTLTATQVWTLPVRAPQTRTFDLLIREREIDHATGQTTITLESDEAYLIDRALVSLEPDRDRAVLAASFRAVVNDVLLDFEAELLPGDDDFDFRSNAEGLTQDPGVSYWDYLQPLVEASGLRLFCDEKRQWRLVKAASYSIDDQINMSITSNLNRGTDKISRYGDWYDSVVVKYTWTDAAGIAHVQYDTAVYSFEITGGLTVPLTVPYVITGTIVNHITKVLKLERNSPFPGPGAARAILERANGRGRELSLGAQSDYRVTPAMTVVASLPDTPIQTGVVSTVQWAFGTSDGSNQMVIGSRGLIDTPLASWLLSPAGRAWNNITTGVQWYTYTP